MAASFAGSHASPYTVSAGKTATPPAATHAPSARASSSRNGHPLDARQVADSFHLREPGLARKRLDGVRLALAVLEDEERDVQRHEPADDVEAVGAREQRAVRLEARHVGHQDV